MRSIRKTIAFISVFCLTLIPVFGQVTVDVISVTVPAYPTIVAVPVVLTNSADEVGGIQFDLTLDPAWMDLTSITATGTGAGFTGDFNALSESTDRIVFYNAASSGTIPTGSDTVMYLNFAGTSVLSGVIDMAISGLIVSDGDGNILASSGTAGGIEIGDVVSLDLTDGEADVMQPVTLQLNMANDGVVGGFQFDLFDTPDYLDVTGFSVTDRTTGFTVETSEVAAGTRFVVYNSNDDNIAAGTGAVLNIDFLVHYNAFERFVGVNMTNVVVVDDIGGEYWIAAADSGTVHVTPGYMEEPHNLEAVSGLDSQVPLMWDLPYGDIPLDITEDFESGALPEGWTTTTNSSVGWFITQDGSSSWWAIPSHTWYACSNDDAADDDGSVDYLITPGLHVGGAQDITLSFQSFYTGAYSQTAHIEVSTDGTNFTEVYSLPASAEWVTETVDLSAYAGTPTLYIAFHSNDNGAWASGWAVDDIVIGFGAGRIAQNVHFNFNELGQWLITADKAVVVAQYPNGITYESTVDWANPIEPEDVSVDRDLSGINIYRSTDGTNFSLLESVAADATTYTDEAVANSTTYYYYLTSVYTPGGESLPSNTVTGTPLEWIELDISDGAALSGAVDTLDITLVNETPISFFYFEITDNPNYFLGESILPTARTNGWSLDVVELPSGSMAITAISLGVPLAAGDTPVCRVIVRGFSDEEGTANVQFTGASIVDMASNEMPWTATGGSFHVTIETQTLFLGSATGNPGELVTVPLVLNNTQNVHGIQVFLVDVPNNATGLSIAPTDYINFSNWTFDASTVDNEYRIIIFDNTLSTPIPPGTGHIANIYYTIDMGTAVGTAINLNPTTVVVSDVNNLPMHTNVIAPVLYTGPMEAFFTIENVSGPDMNNDVSFDIGLTNTEAVYVMDLDLFDLPNNITVQSFTPIGRFSAGTVDGSSGEDAFGVANILAYQFTTGIVPGTGAVLTVHAHLSIPGTDVLAFIQQATSADIAMQPLNTGKGGFLIVSGNYVGIDPAVQLPDEFALRQNYPNPFNPTTRIEYDLKEAALVSLNIFDLNGRKIKTLVQEVQPAGRQSAVWNATDNSGRQVSAGVYIYQIRANDFVSNRKMILLK